MSSGRANTGEAETRAARTAFTVGAVALAGLQIVLSNYFVPLRNIFQKTPLTGDDYDLHIGQVFRVVEGLDGWGKSWVYDVQLLAGQPEGTILDSGSKGWELWTYFLHRLGVDRAIAFNLFVLLVMLACPALLYAAARTFRVDRGAALVAGFMGSSLWFFDSHIHWLWFIGMVSWALAASLSPLTVAVFYRLVTSLAESDDSSGRISARHWALAALSGLILGVGLLIHPYIFFAVLAPMTATYVSRWRAISIRGHAAVVAVGLAALAMNAYWLRNAALHWHYVLNSAFYAQGGPRFLACDFFDVLCSGADSGVIGTRAGFRFLYLALGLAGLVALRRERDPRFLTLSVAVVSAYFCAYVGGHLPGLEQTQPYRQITPGAFFTTLPAAIFLVISVREAFARFAFPLSALLGIAVAALAHRLFVGDVLYFLPRVIPEPEKLLDGSPSPVSKYGYLWPFTTASYVNYGVPHEAYIEGGIPDVIAWLDEHVPEHARVLAQGAMMGERLAWQGRFEVIGGFVERNVAHAYTNYFRSYPFAGPASHPPSEDEIARYLRVFAIGWVVSNYPEFDHRPDILERVAVVHNWNVYRTREAINAVLRGGGSVRASENLIQVRGSDPTEPIVLSYHWHEALRCRPDCHVEVAPVDIDRVGLIQVPPPHASDVDIYNSYEMR